MGGGGSSGTIEYPEYLSGAQQNAITRMTLAVDVARSGNSPFADAIAADPSDALAAAWSRVCSYETAIEALSPDDDLADFINNAVARVEAFITDPTYEEPDPGAEAEISDSVTAYEAVQSDILTNETLPIFRAGMRDINAVQSSAFTLGEAYITAMHNRDVSKYQGDLRIRAFLLRDELLAKNIIAKNDFNLKLEGLKRDAIVRLADVQLKELMFKIESLKSLAYYAIEAKRIHIVAEKEETDKNIEIEDMDARWDLEVNQYMNGVIASISGGVSPIGRGSTSKSALGGALGGAATGAMIGSEIMPGWGTAIGAVVGGVAGWLTS